MALLTIKKKWSDVKLLVKKQWRRILVSLGIITIAFAAGVTNDCNNRILKKVNQVGYQYIHRFEKNGVIIERQTTREDYVQLGTKNPVNPILEGGKWLLSYEAPRFDTPNGQLNEGEFSLMELEKNNILAHPRCKEIGTAEVKDFQSIENGIMKQSAIGSWNK